MSEQLPHEEPLFRMICVVHIDFITLFDYQFFNKLQQFSVKNHKQNSLSSVVCFSDGIFLNYVEGNEQDLTDLKNIILVQKNHRLFTLVEFTAIDYRQVPNNFFKLVFLNKYIFNSPFKEFLPFEPDNWDIEKHLTLVQCVQDQQSDQMMEDISKIGSIYLQFRWLISIVFKKNLKADLLIIACCLLLTFFVITLIALMLTGY